LAPPADPERPAAAASPLRRLLARRAGVRAALGRLFDGRGFVEVDTPVLSSEVMPEAHIDPIPVAVDGARGGIHWLQASPEALMKRLLARGSGPIYQFARSFRAGERGTLHDVEFVLLEWYAPEATLDSTAPLLEEVCRTVLGTEGIDRVTCRDAFLGHAGIDPHAATLGDWRRAGDRLGLGIAPPHDTDADADSWFEMILAGVVGPRLGRGGRPTMLEAWPATQSAFARLDPGDPSLARRFELFVDGVELANGWEEDPDRDLLARRIDAANRIRSAAGRETLPCPRRVLEAHGPGMPEGVGAALGFDRLVMLAAGATTIDAARPFGVGEA